MTRSFAVRLLQVLSLVPLAVALALPAHAIQDDDDRDRDRDDRKVVTTYFQNFHVFGGIFPRRLVDNGAAGKLDVLIHAFVDIRGDQAGHPVPHCAAFDGFADYGFFFDNTRSVDASIDSFAPGSMRGIVHQFQELKKLFPHLKILASIGGFTAGSKGFEAAAATPASRKAFVADCINSYIKGNFSNTLGLVPVFDSGPFISTQGAMDITPAPGIFDGFDIDWEFPVQAQRENFVALLKEFREQLDALGKGHILTVALPAGRQDFSQIDLPGAAAQANFVHLLTFDYSGPFNNHTGFVAPLFQTKFDPSTEFNVNFTVQSYLAAGVPAHKMLMGIPFFDAGWSVTGASAPDQHGQFVDSMNSPDNGSGKPPDYTGSVAAALDPALAGGPLFPTQPQSFVQLHVLQFSQIFRAEPGDTPFAFDESPGNSPTRNFWSFEDNRSLRAKTRFIRQHGLGGAFIFEEPDELPDGSLFNTVVNGLRRDDDE